MTNIKLTAATVVTATAASAETRNYVSEEDTSLATERNNIKNNDKTKNGDENYVRHKTKAAIEI